MYINIDEVRIVLVPNAYKSYNYYWPLSVIVDLRTCSQLLYQLKLTAASLKKGYRAVI